LFGNSWGKRRNLPEVSSRSFSRQWREQNRRG